MDWDNVDWEEIDQQEQDWRLDEQHNEEDEVDARAMNDKKKVTPLRWIRDLYRCVQITSITCTMEAC